MKRVILISLIILITTRIVQQLYFRTNDKQTQDLEIKSQQKFTLDVQSQRIQKPEDCNRTKCSYNDKKMLNFGFNEVVQISSDGTFFDSDSFYKKGFIYELKEIFSWILSSIDIWKGNLVDHKVRVVYSITTSLNQVLNPSISELVTGLTLGKEAVVTTFNYHLFKVTGTQHLLAISGFNLSLFIGLISHLYTNKLKKSIVFGFDLTISVFFLCLVGMSPGIIRAFLMFCLSRFTWLNNKSNNGVFLLLVTVIISLITDIQLLFNFSFQLSYAATFGILLISKHFSRSSDNIEALLLGFPRVGKNILYYFWTSILVSLSAQIAVLPLVLYHFGEISIIGILSTTLVSWLIAPIMIFGYLFIVLQFILPFNLLFLFSLLLTMMVLVFLFALNLLNFDWSIVTFPNFSAWHAAMSYCEFGLIYTSIFIFRKAKCVIKHEKVHHFNF